MNEPLVLRDRLEAEQRQDMPGSVQRRARLGLVLVLVALSLWTIHDFLPALVWAVVLAIAFWPFYQRTLRRFPPGKHNVLIPGLFAVGLGLVFGVPLLILLVEGAREFHDALDLYRQAKSSGIPVPDWVSHLPFGGDAVHQWWQDNLAGGIEPGALTQRINKARVAEVSETLAKNVAHRTVLFFFALMTLFFLLKEGEAVVGQALTASGKLFGTRGERIALQMVASVHGTVDGLVLVGLGEGFIMGIIYAVAGVSHPILFGVLTALGAMVPFAVTVVFLLVGAVLVAQGSVAAAVIVVVVGSVLAFLADHLVRPALIGGTTRLPFLWVLIGILGGIETWGLLGLFIGPALMAATILLWREFTGQEDAQAA